MTSRKDLDLVTPGGWCAGVFKDEQSNCKITLHKNILKAKFISKTTHILYHKEAILNNLLK